MLSLGLMFLWFQLLSVVRAEAAAVAAAARGESFKTIH
jgi:hypothetical protein